MDLSLWKKRKAIDVPPGRVMLASGNVYLRVPDFNANLPPLALCLSGDRVGVAQELGEEGACIYFDGQISFEAESIAAFGAGKVVPGELALGCIAIGSQGAFAMGAYSNLNDRFSFGINCGGSLLPLGSVNDQSFILVPEWKLMAVDPTGRKTELVTVTGKVAD